MNNARPDEGTGPGAARPNTDDERVSLRVQSVEVGVFLFLILSAVVSSVFFVADQEHMRFTAAAVSSILSDLSLLALVLYFVWRNGEPPRRIGWTRRDLAREIGLGLLLFVPVTGAVNVLENFLVAAGFSAPTKLPTFLSASGVGGVVLALLLVTVVAVVEETIFRGYLILRLRAVTGRTDVAVVLSSVIFSLGHGYEGTAGMIAVFALGLIFALVYVWRKSLVASIVMHFLVDFGSIVLIAILNLKH